MFQGVFFFYSSSFYLPLGLRFYGLSFNLFYSAPVAVSDALRKGRFEIFMIRSGVGFLMFFFDDLQCLCFFGVCVRGMGWMEL
jgi:hypothetical protein